MARRIGILGGTFDPVHIGHLILASCARDQLDTDDFLFIPNARSPLKAAAPVASFADRLEMLRLAIGDVRGFRVSDIEGRRGGISYMVETLKELRTLFPDSDFFLILGADSARDLPRWRESHAVLQMVQLALVTRDGVLPDEGAPGSRVIQMPRIDISASAIRAQVAAGASIDFLTPAAVASYIARVGLYRSR